MDIVCNLSSIINMPNNSLPAILTFKDCSKNSPVMNVLRKKIIVECCFKHFKNSVKYEYIKHITILCVCTLYFKLPNKVKHVLISC